MIFVSVPNIKTEIYAKSQHKSIFKQKQPPTENIFNVKDKYKTSDLLKIKKKTLKEIIVMKKIYISGYCFVISFYFPVIDLKTYVTISTFTSIYCHLSHFSVLSNV